MPMEIPTDRVASCGRYVLQDEDAQASLGELNDENP